MKGAYAGLNSLCCEWVANRLAESFQPEPPLALPASAMGLVPKALIEVSDRPDVRDLGTGLVFASRRIHEVLEPDLSATAQFPPETMAQLLLLDLWLRNDPVLL